MIPTFSKLIVGCYGFYPKKNITLFYRLKAFDVKVILYGAQLRLWFVRVVTYVGMWAGMYGCHTLTDILACALYVFPLVQLHQGVGVGVGRMDTLDRLSVQPGGGWVCIGPRTNSLIGLTLSPFSTEKTESQWG